MSKKSEYKSLEKRLYPNGTEVCTITSNTLAIRYEQSVKWYIKKANCLKICYYLFNILAFLSLGIIPIINSIPYTNDYHKIIVNIFSGLSATATSFISLFKFKEKWIHYRTIAEVLQTELSIYTESAGKYKNLSDSIKNKRLVETIEKIMTTEHKQWKEIIKNNMEEYNELL